MEENNLSLSVVGKMPSTEGPAVVEEEISYGEWMKAPKPQRRGDWHHKGRETRFRGQNIKGGSRFNVLNGYEDHNIILKEDFAADKYTQGANEGKVTGGKKVYKPDNKNVVGEKNGGRYKQKDRGPQDNKQWRLVLSQGEGSGTKRGAQSNELLFQSSAFKIREVQTTLEKEKHSVVEVSRGRVALVEKENNFNIVEEDKEGALTGASSLDAGKENWAPKPPDKWPKSHGHKLQSSILKNLRVRKKESSRAMSREAMETIKRDI